MPSIYDFMEKEYDELSAKKASLEKTLEDREIGLMASGEIAAELDEVNRKLRGLN